MKLKLLFGVIICTALVFTACQKRGEFNPPPAEVILDTILTYNVNLVYNTDWAPVEQKIDSTAICNLFGISYAEFKSMLIDNGDNSGEVKYYAITPLNTVDATAPTANGNGHWFAAAGSVCTWDVGKLYSEYQENLWAFNIGSNPDNTTAGQNYTIRQGFLYAPDDLTTYLAICVFNVSIVAP